MRAERRLALGCLSTWLFLAAPPSLGAEPTEEMQTLARMFAALEAGSMPRYCQSKLSPLYVDYLNRACQAAIQNKVKTPEDCSSERIALQVKSDTAQCLAMSAAEFDATVLRGAEGRRVFAAELEARGVDSEELIKAERAKLR